MNIEWNLYKFQCPVSMIGNRKTNRNNNKNEHGPLLQEVDNVGNDHN